MAGSSSLVRVPAISIFKANWAIVNPERDDCNHAVFEVTYIEFAITVEKEKHISLTVKSLPTVEVMPYILLGITVLTFGYIHI